jgi:TolB protein
MTFSNLMPNMRQRMLLCTSTLLSALLLALPGLLAAQAPPEKRPLDHTLPVVSADGRQIFFIGDAPTVDNLYAVRPDGSEEQRLTHDGAHLPRWAGKPAEITYAGTGTSPDSGRVFAFNPDRTRRMIASVPGRSPVLSADGTHVAYLVGPWRTTEIWVSTLDGAGARKVAGGKLDDGGEASAWNPAWSPDGSRIAYTYGDSTRRQQVHIVKVVGSVRDTAITDTLEAQVAWQMPAWSADGTKLAMQWNKDQGQGSGIAVIDLTTRTFRLNEIPLREGRDPVRDETPSWFPDNKHIVFRSNRSGNVDLWMMAEDGTGVKQVTGIDRR